MAPYTAAKLVSYFLFAWFLSKNTKRITVTSYKKSTLSISLKLNVTSFARRKYTIALSTFLSNASCLQTLVLIDRDSCLIYDLGNKYIYTCYYTVSIICMKFSKDLLASRFTAGLDVMRLIFKFGVYCCVVVASPLRRYKVMSNKILREAEQLNVRSLLR